GLEVEHRRAPVLHADPRERLPLDYALPRRDAKLPPRQLLDLTQVDDAIAEHRAQVHRPRAGVERQDREHTTVLGRDDDVTGAREQVDSGVLAAAAIVVDALGSERPARAAARTGDRPVGDDEPAGMLAQHRPGRARWHAGRRRAAVDGGEARILER